MKADRYCITGILIPVILPGTLTMLNRALKDAQSASRFIDDEITVSAVHGKTRSVIRTFEDGICTWQPEQEQES